MKEKHLIIIILFFSIVFANKVFAKKIDRSREIRIATSADSVIIINSLPTEHKGIDIVEKPTFKISTLDVDGGFIKIEITSEPIWIIENKLPKTKNLETQSSPFGFLPANADINGSDYTYAKEIGVDWERGGLKPYFWFRIQPDPNIQNYYWEELDHYFKNVPQGIQQVKNIMIGRVNKRFRKPNLNRFMGNGSQKSPLRRPRTNDLSLYLEAMTYRPKDPESFTKWVKAMVERYDGDGIDDMPGLKTYVKYWQIANEPSNNTDGYVELVQIASKAIKEADPDAKVLMGGIFLPFHSRMRYEKSQLPLLQKLNGKYIDIIDLHWFGNIGGWKKFPAALSRVREDLKKCNFIDIPIWMTEVGTYSGKPNARRRKIYPYQSEREQAIEMVKRYVVALGERIEKIFWAWGMMEGYANPYDNDFFDNTGFVYNGIGPNDPGKGTKKIIYWTYQKMTQLLSYWNGTAPEKIDVAQDVFAYRFRLKDGESGIVNIWSAE